MLGRKPLSVAQAFLAPNRPLDRIVQPQNITSEPFFITNIVKESGVTGNFWKRTEIGANNRATTGLRFNDRPTKTFES